MKQEYTIRIVTQDGKLSLRRCLLDPNGDISYVSPELFAFKADNKEELIKQLEMANLAILLPILTAKSDRGSGWLNQYNFTGGEDEL